MARKYGSIESGKLGDKILYTWNGRQCERSMPKSVANPRSEAQQAHRSAFAMVSRLSSQMKEAHLVGLHWDAVREKNNSYGVFRRMNKDCCDGGEVDYARVVVSRGPVAPMYFAGVEVDEGGVLRVRMEGAVGSGDARDELFVFVYCAELEVGHLVEPVRRCEGEVAVVLPEEWLGRGMHLYAFMRDRRGRTSSTSHCELS